MRRVVAIIVKEGAVLSVGDNEHSPCPREGFPTGEGYELCEGCDYPNHAEWKAIKNALLFGKDIKDSTLYLHGHTYACEPCKDACEKVGIRIVVVDK